MRSRSLLDLQQVDLRRDDTVARLKQVLVALRANPALAETRAAVERASEQVASIERRLRHDDLERQGVKARIAQEEQRLYSGRVTSPKELQGLEMEVGVLKRKLSEFDDAVLELMLQRDDAVRQLDAANSALAATTSETASAVESLTREKAHLTAALRQIDAERLGAVKPIPPADVALYERLRQEKGGRAVAELTGEHCGTCGMQLPRHDLDDVRAGKGIVHCAACGRILHG